ncbi:MAG: hypothetical protein LM590_05615 [Thermofilum sp.]|nr:hypothetical protein [Thermofilum sp.]
MAGPYRSSPLGSRAEPKPQAGSLALGLRARGLETFIAAGCAIGVVLRSLWARGFLSLRDVRVELGKLNVLVVGTRAGRATLLEPSRCSPLMLEEGPCSRAVREAWRLVFRFDGAGWAEVGVEADLVR